MATTAAPLKFLSPAWFSMVMGLCGLALAWHAAVPLMGDLADAIALVVGAAALLVFVLLAGATLVRIQRHPDAWQEDLKHPVRHTFVATMPIGLLLLATLLVALFGAGPVAELLWWVGSLGLLLVTLWLLSSWWIGNKPGGLQWAVVTPPLIVPVVGNVLVPLAGVALGRTEWATAQFGIGLLFWPIVLTLLLVRLAVQGMWPERLLPATFIFIAPPAVIGLSLLQLGAPRPLAWLMWGMALFMFLWAGRLMTRIIAVPFGVTHWGLSFPLTALAALTLRLATPGSGLLAVLGPLLLALSSLVILTLLLGTWRGLRQGTLLAPEPVATIAPVSAG